MLTLFADIIIKIKAIEKLRSLSLLTKNLIYRRYDVMAKKSIPQLKRVCQVKSRCFDYAQQANNYIPTF